MSENASAPTPTEKDKNAAHDLWLVIAANNGFFHENYCRQKYAEQIAAARQEGRQESAELLREAKEALEIAESVISNMKTLLPARYPFRDLIEAGHTQVSAVLKKLQEEKP